MNGDDPRHDARMRRESPPRRAGESPAYPRQPHPGEARWGSPAPRRQPPRQQPPPQQPARRQAPRGPRPEDRREPPGGPAVNRTRRMPRNEPEPALAWSQVPPPKSEVPPPKQPPPRQSRRAPDAGAPTHAPTQRPVPHRAASPPPPASPPRATRGRGARPPRGPRPKRKRHWGRWLLALLVLLVSLPIAAAFYVENNLVRIDAITDYDDRVGDTPGTNWLLVGSDSRAGLTPEREQELATGGEVGSERTDTIILVHMPRSGRPTLVSLPRDSYVSIPGYGRDKLNAAFSFGGAQLLTQTVEIATGLHIDHYAQIGFGGFADVVDAVGGIDMCLPNPIDDPLAGIDLPAGCQRLNGAQALGFVRSRATALADLDRMNNQRMFMAALLQKATATSTLVNPFRAWPLLRDTTKSLRVDQGAHVWDVARLGWALRDDPVATTVPIGGFTDTASGNVLLWDKTKASQFFEALAADEPIPDELLTPGI
ncbi:LCP family protein [Nocardia otitidiscaviarum]|uniref:LCP family protein n=1 Tax=Nocardia otitidiscaviarum TaxID=1823 RepID=UPI0018932EA5|nr:LCP family protein [Nocardia otitidiscaviarum]